MFHFYLFKDVNCKLEFCVLLRNTSVFVESVWRHEYTNDCLSLVEDG